MENSKGGIKVMDRQCRNGGQDVLLMATGLFFPPWGKEARLAGWEKGPGYWYFLFFLSMDGIEAWV